MNPLFCILQVMKPMLERKRRARINRCLDELKELMVAALQSEGENVSKLEKADILELTVRHLHKLRRHHALSVAPEASYADRFRAGFTHCAAEVSQYLAGSGTIDATVSSRLLAHLGHCIRQMDKPPTPLTPTGQQQPCASTYTPPSSPLAYGQPALTPMITVPPMAHQQHLQKCASPVSSVSSSVWRPW